MPPEDHAVHDGESLTDLQQSSSEDRTAPQVDDPPSLDGNFDAVDWMWLFSETDASAHIDGRYLRAAPETVIDAEEWR